MFVEKSIKTEYGQLYYLESDNKGLPLIHLHGAVGKPNMAYSLEKYLNGKVKIIASYLPDHGKSFKTNNQFSYRDLLFVIQKFINSICNTSPILMGHSFGGRIAWDLTVTKKVDVDKLILIAPALNVNNGFLQTSLNVFKDLYSDRDYSQLPKNDYLVRDSQYLRVFSIWKIVKNALFVDKYLYPEVKTLVMWGKNDTVLPFETHKSIIEKIKDKQIMLFDGGHYCYKRNPEKFFKTIAGFISK